MTKLLAEKHCHLYTNAMDTIVFPCQDLAAKILLECTDSAKEFTEKFSRSPNLAVVLVGDDPASHVYVRKKGETCEKHNIAHLDIRLPKDSTQAELEDHIHKLNQDDSVDGILVQSPIPSHLDEKKIHTIINPDKDVDCFHPINSGKLFLNAKKSMQKSMVPCTPAGVMEVFKENNIELTGKKAVVIGRSNLVGKPMAQMLLAENATVTICHSRTKNLAEECKNADIIVAAIGKANFLRKEHMREGHILIDVGINRIEVDGKFKLVGDICREDALGIAQFITPVPKGIGPMTIALLIRNCVRAAWARKEKMN